MSEDFYGYKSPLAYLDAYQAETARLCRLKKADLIVEYRRELESKNIISLVGGPVTKDELISAIMRERFPRYREAAEANGARIAAQQRKMDIHSLTMRLINVSDEDLAEALRGVGDLARLHRAVTAALLRQQGEAVAAMEAKVSDARR